MHYRDVVNSKYLTTEVDCRRCLLILLIWWSTDSRLVVYEYVIWAKKLYFHSPMVWWNFKFILFDHREILGRDGLYWPWCLQTLFSEKVNKQFFFLSKRLVFNDIHRENSVIQYNSLNSVQEWLSGCLWPFSYVYTIN